MNDPYISRIRIYPVKSLDAMELKEAEIGIHSLKNDRVFAMMAADGHYINGKRTERVNQLKAEYDLDKGLIHLTPRSGHTTTSFKLEVNNKELNNYLENFFETKLSLIESKKGELLDKPKVSSVTVVSQSSLQSLQNDFKEYSLEDIRLRFRSSIEIEGVDAYWEENLFKEPGTGVRFTIGDVEMIGISPRLRCNVPPRNPLTGETDNSFVKRMMTSRSNSLLENSNLPLYGNTYHLAVNAYIPESETGKVIKVGDPIRILETLDKFYLKN